MANKSVPGLRPGRPGPTLSPGYAKCHQSLIDCHWGFRKLLEKRGAYCESDTMNARRVGRKALPEECVASTHFSKRSFVGKSCFTQSYVVSV